MFIGKYEQNGEIFNNIYYKWDAWQEDTFSPNVKNIELLEFKIGGKTYEERKNNLQQLAIDYQLQFAWLPWSYVELYEIENYFQTNAKRYGLLKEFKENCIC